MAKRLRELYYITHIDNLPSILKHGIFSHAEVKRRKVDYRPVYDTGIVNWRQHKQTPDGRSLWCGLGGLDWAQVGPLMCRYLSGLDIEVRVHLPLEKRLPDEQLRREFLLR